MSRSILSALLVFLLVSGPDDARAQSRFEQFRDKLAQGRPWLKNIPNADYYSSCSGREAFRMLTLFRVAPGPGFEDQKQAVADAARRNDDLRDFLMDKLLNTPVLVENTGHRHSYFYALSYLKSEWATKLAGDLLVEAEPLRTERYESLEKAKKIFEGNYGNNTRDAAWVIGEFDYPGYPSKEQIWQYKRQDIEECRSWWIENVVEKSQVKGGAEDLSLPEDRSGALEESSFVEGEAQPTEKDPFRMTLLFFVAFLLGGIVLFISFKKKR